MAMPDEPNRDRPKRSVLFVCTGNTCRSPLAEALCRVSLGKRLGCDVSDLARSGFVIRSAGVMAYPGAEASPEAVDVAKAYGADLANHRSRPVDRDLLAEATDVIAMTEGHAAMLALSFPNIGPEPRLLCGAEDLPDPIGGDDAIYRACAAAITAHLDRLIADWTTP
jgi:protein-tyrosine-phosphatase